MTRRTSWTASELMTVTFPEPKWAVPGVIPEGLTLLVGTPKLGKSWLVLNMACAISAGGRALGSIGVEAGPVLYLALEDNGRRLQSRLTKVLQGDQAPADLHLATELEPMVSGGEERVRRWLDDHPNARMLAIDVLAKVRGRTTREVSVYEADYAAVSALKAIADEYSVATVVVHHTRKSGADDFLDTVSGSHGLAGAADTIAVLSRSRGSADGVLKITGRDVMEAEHALAFEPASGTWRLLDGIPSDLALSDTRRRILEVVRERLTVTPRDVDKVLTDVSYDTIRQTMRRMVPDQLDDDGQGNYFEPALSHVTPVTAVTEPVTPVTTVTVDVIQGSDA